MEYENKILDGFLELMDVYKEYSVCIGRSASDFYDKKLDIHRIIEELSKIEGIEGKVVENIFLSKR